MKKMLFGFLIIGKHSELSKVSCLAKKNKCDDGVIKQEP